MKEINIIIEGGKATAGPPLGPALGPLGINAGKVVEEINEKTKGFSGVKIPVKVIVDPKTKEFFNRGWISSCCRAFKEKSRY